MCNTGLIREINQDNLWCNHVFLKSVNNGLPGILAGTNDTATLPIFAVFDGMGGEQQGEMAAYIAANSFDKLLEDNDKSKTKEFLLNACTILNRNICDYQTENQIRNMGTTAAIVVFGTDEIFICNIGDSRIYHYSGRDLTQISFDHVETGVNSRKAPLTQNLGISENEFIIEPYIAKGRYRNKDCFLICSDGLTDMLTDKQITEIFRKKMTMKETTQRLMDMALANGGVDNITLIVCKVKKT